jgi:cold shock CspA family protein
VQAGDFYQWGKVKSFNKEKKHGYIVVENLHRDYGMDVYAFEDVLQKAKAGPGDGVACFIHWSAKGQPQASMPMMRYSAREGVFALKGTYKPGKEGQKHGFLENVEAKEFFGRDVYVRAELAEELQPGQVVAFNCFINKEGMPNVDALEPCEEDWEPEAGDLGESAVAEEVVPKGKAKGKGKPLKPHDGGAPPGKPTSTDREMTGRIKSYVEKNNYGFIESEECKEEFGSDVFVHGMELTGFQVGDEIIFDLALNTKGQPQALNVRPADGPPKAKKQKTADAPAEEEDGFLEGYDDFEGQADALLADVADDLGDAEETW